MTTITCTVCGLERTKREANDYNPMQVLTGQPLGWYSGPDGEFCGPCMADLIRGANS